MGSLQLRLILTSLATILVTLGLAALSLFLLIGGYRDTISHENLEDVGRLIDAQANDEISDRVEIQTELPAGPDLLLQLRSTLASEDPSEEPATIAIVDSRGRVIPGLFASQYALDGATIENLDRVDATVRSPVPCKLKANDTPDLLCVRIPLSEAVLRVFPGVDATAIVVAEPAASLREVFGDLVPRLLFSGIIGIFAALIFGFVLSQSVAAPLRNIARAARNVARGNYRQRVPATGPSEVRDLAANFNRMTEQVQRSQQTLRDFLANISHELKTPLTSIRGFSEAILDGTIDDRDGTERSARIISTESTRVLRLVEELLDLSRIESGQVPMRLEEFGVDELVNHVGDVFALRSEESGVKLELALKDGVRVHGDFERLEQVLNNLMDNAFRYSPDGGLVRVTTTIPQPGFVEVCVADNGKGIPADELPFLFDRFYRAHGSTSKGYGLGLAIAREIVKAHGGDIWATSELGHGTQFHFTLPTARHLERPRNNDGRA